MNPNAQAIYFTFAIALAGAIALGSHLGIVIVIALTALYTGGGILL